MLSPAVRNTYICILTFYSHLNIVEAGHSEVVGLIPQSHTFFTGHVKPCRSFIIILFYPDMVSGAVLCYARSLRSL